MENINMSGGGGGESVNSSEPRPRPEPETLRDGLQDRDFFNPGNVMHRDYSTWQTRPESRARLGGGFVELIWTIWGQVLLT